MNQGEVSGLVGRVQARASVSGFHAPAWARALAPLDAGRAGTVLVRYLNGLRPSDDPVIADFLHLYGPLPTGHPLDQDDTPPPPPRPSRPCEVCDSTGWVLADESDPSAGSKPCTCAWGAQVAPVAQQIAATPPALRVMPVADPPWRREGITAVEWTRRHLGTAS